MFKVFSTLVKEGKNLGTGILCEDFDTLEAAKAAGKEQLLFPGCFYTVKEYDARNVTIVGGECDTGKEIYSSLSELAATECIELCSYTYEHNDGDQIWEDETTFYKENGKIKKVFIDGYYGNYGKPEETYVSEAKMLEEMEKVKDKVEKTKQGYYHRGGYKIIKTLNSIGN